MYAIIPQQIPQGKRAEVNEKILFAINSGKDLIPAESIYNCYTGVGGLHNLRQSDFASYHEYAQAKKEFEMGQFFTPHEICREMVDVLSPTSSEMVLDMCCGMGNFFNHLPNRHNTYGFDIDGKAVAVARYLYPDAHIEKCDIQQYRPEQRFDIIIGNPPFNLKFDFRLSQEYYMDKAYDLLNPAGILMIVVPSSFMQSEFWEKRRITGINGKFSFVGQCGLAPHALHQFDVTHFGGEKIEYLGLPDVVYRLDGTDNLFVVRITVFPRQHADGIHHVLVGHTRGKVLVHFRHVIRHQFRFLFFGQSARRVTGKSGFHIIRGNILLFFHILRRRKRLATGRNLAVDFRIFQIDDIRLADDLVVINLRSDDRLSRFLFLLGKVFYHILPQAVYPLPEQKNPQTIKEIPAAYRLDTEIKIGFHGYNGLESSRLYISLISSQCRSIWSPRILLM